LVNYFFVIWKVREKKKSTIGWWIFKKTIEVTEDWRFEEEVLDKHPTIQLQDLRKRNEKYKKEHGIIYEIYIQFMCPITEPTYNLLKKDDDGKVKFDGV